MCGRLPKRKTMSAFCLSRGLRQRLVHYTVVQWRTQEFFSGGGSINSVEERENGDLVGGNPLVRGSGGSCNLVQEISFRIVKFSQFLAL